MYLMTLFDKRLQIMQSGGVNSVPAIPAEMFQDNYDAFIAAIGCQDAEDTFTCLKEADLTTVANTVNAFVAAPQKYSPRVGLVPSNLFHSSKQLSALELRHRRRDHTW
jgi:hypothetical protein